MARRSRRVSPTSTSRTARIAGQPVGKGIRHERSAVTGKFRAATSAAGSAEYSEAARVGSVDPEANDAPDIESMTPEVRAAYIELVATQVADWSAELNRRLA
ncbi:MULTISPECIES: hypothetical protein [Gordonia]|uniref:hypothetical protein n=1 Tax=Gordonia TaxID=2053 RepID=UPI000A93F84E|nr:MULTISPECIES: hypothetical protein [Gordonia]